MDNTIPTKSVYDIDPNIDLQMSPEDYGKIEALFEQTTTRKVVKFSKSLYNLRLIIERDKSLQGIWYNELTDQIEVHGAPLWERDDTMLLWDERDTINLREYIYDNYSIEYSKQDVEDYALILANRHRYNPIKKYLENLPKWDQTPRIETMFIDYFGAEDNPYTRDVSLKWAIAAIKRVYQPGCKYDNVPVLTGPQGIGKSTFFRMLGGEYFSDSLTFLDMADTKKAGEKTQGTWINEISELNGIRKQDIGTVKNFISSTKAIYREAYGRKAKVYPRRYVLIGTTNDDNFLFDDTGNRRFQPIQVTGEGELDPTHITQETVDQIWAEALYRYKEKPDIELCLEKENIYLAEKAQADALEVSDLEGIIQYYLDQKLPQNWNDGYNLGMRLTYLRTYSDDDPTFLDSEGNDTRVARTEVSIPEIWCECLGESMERLTRGMSLNINRCLTKLHWVKGKGGQMLPDGEQNPFPERKYVSFYGQNRMHYRSSDVEKYQNQKKKKKEK